ncbi:hypothetical protein PR202_ga10203 [Eleusine coracana subsp. coracana]|uniref:RING-type E3 ubiquitin transferase n=1 Tax=Eleusine coracana subsp. coracana TaxID=191504 RepID=A0AAV5C668_ELECO|nr:hypothetical protein PR202_ga10203 [Eleusine coracana subsp. coracana]
MAFRNMVCTPQVIDLESERGQARAGNGDISDQGAQHNVRVVENVTSFGLSDMRSYYDVSVNHQHLPVHNPPSNLVADSGFAFASSMYNPCISSTSVHRYASHPQSYGSGNLSLPINQVPGSMDESGRNDNLGESARGHVKRKNAAVAGSYHFVNGFAGSSSSSHAPQNHALRPWDPSFESNVPPNIVPFNPSEHQSHSGWSSMEGSSITGANGFNSVVRPESAQRGNYTFPTTHISHAWMSQAANGIADGVPYVNATSNVQGRFAHSGATEVQHGTIMDFSRLYEVSNVVDEHRDMRLDIDSMTYEELLALEERIGDVNTGLTKSHIVDKLRTSFYMPGTSGVADQSSKSSLESDACIICQEEYQDKDCIGILDCGHRYHAECVKQWLTVKNICPICKTTALSADRRNGQ